MTWWRITPDKKEAEKEKGSKDVAPMHGFGYSKQTDPCAHDFINDYPRGVFSPLFLYTADGRYGDEGNDYYRDSSSYAQSE